MTWRQQCQSLDELRKLATTNTAFIKELQLPKSRQLAEKLSRILDVGVGFYFAKQGPGDWPSQLDGAIRKLASQNKAAASRAKGYHLATAPFADGSSSLILIRKTSLRPRELADHILVPALIFTVACAILATLMGSRIVKPLSTLARWLPNLNTLPGGELVPVPPSITSRNDEIGRLALALEQTTQDLCQEQQLRRQSEHLAALGRIATSLAHEIKNPAAAIALHADCLSEPGADTHPQSIALIREEVGRITDLVNQWLFVARPAPPRKKTHDLRDLLDNVSRRMRPLLDHAHANLSINTPAATPIRIRVDAPRIEQAIRNLLLNAAQAMPAGGEIQAHLHSDGQSATLAIEDDGTGFSKAALEHLGEAFFSEREGGMGIGLTLAREVALAHGGSLAVGKSVRLRGACLTLTLPLLNDSPDNPL